MAGLTYLIELGDEAVAPDFYGAVLSLTATEDVAAAGSLRLRLRVEPDADGAWPLLDDDRLGLFRRVKVSIGFGGGSGFAGAVAALAGGGDAAAPVFDGYVTAVAPAFDAQPGESVLEVQAADTSVLLGLEDKVATWPNLADSDIVRRIVDRYGVRAVVTDTPTTHQEADTTVVQRGTDLQFVRELARRNGAEFYFETDAATGEVAAHFGPPRLDGTPQPDLAVRFGDASNLRNFHVRLAGQRPLSVKVRQMDVKADSPNEARVTDLSRTRLGARDLADLAGAALDEAVSPQDAHAQLLLLGPPTSDPTELRTLAQAARDEAGWCVRARGEVNAEAYGAVLRPRRVVLVKGAGRAFSGKYYVTHVAHTLTADGGYTQAFEAVRNARDLDGSESFGGGGPAVTIPGVL